MIIDTISNGEKYFCAHPSFTEAFKFIGSQNLQSMEPGEYEINGEKLKVIISNNAGRAVEEATSKFECHNNYIDIQLCIKGKEKIGWKPRVTCLQPRGEYNPNKDVLFYNDAPDMYFELMEGQFAIFFPEDVHAPMIGQGNIKKLVIKVRV